MKKLRFVVLFLLSVIIFSFAFIYIENKLNETQEPEDPVQSADTLDESQLGEDNTIEKLVDHELLFLLVGTDFSKAEDKGRCRTDTLILVKVDSKTGEISLISIPRDTYVRIGDRKTKINHAHAYGGITLTLKTVRELLGLDIDYYVRVNFEAVKDIIDAIGGVKIDVPNTLTKEKDEVDVPAGHQKLNGEQALAVVRARKYYATGDMGRVEFQQYFMTELVDQLVSPKNITKLPALYKTYQKRVDTNIPNKMILEMIPSAINFSSDKMRTYIVPGSPGYLSEKSGRVSYYFPELDELHEMVEEVMPEYVLFDYETKDNKPYWNTSKVDWN